MHRRGPLEDWQFSSPWLGSVYLQPRNQFKDTIKSFHQISHTVLEDDLTAELRPNFSAVPLTREKSRSLRLSRIPSQTQRFNRPNSLAAHSRHHSTSTVETYSSCPSLELAQEPLGGGRGDEAKLGKLLIYPHGQEFMDLLVAANLLVFNRIYQQAMQRL